MKPRKYNWLFRETKVSHTTLQSVLSYLIKKEFVQKNIQGYVISERGEKVLKKLIDLKRLLD